MRTFKYKADARRAARRAGLADDRFELVEADGRWTWRELTQRSPARGKRLGIGKLMAERLRAGDETEAILAAVRERFPESRATGKDVAIVRSKVRRGAL